MSGGRWRRRDNACAVRHRRSAAWAEQPKVPAAQRVEWLRREVLDVDMHEAEVIVLEGAFAFDGLRRCRLGSAIEALGLEDAPDAVAVEMRQEMGDDKCQVIEGEVGDPAQHADNGALLLGDLPGQLVRSRRVVQAVFRTPLAPLADGRGGDAIALGEDAGALMGAGDLGTRDGRGAGVRMDLQHCSDLPLSGRAQTFEQVAVGHNSMPHRVPTMFRNLTIRRQAVFTPGRTEQTWRSGGHKNVALVGGAGWAVPH